MRLAAFAAAALATALGLLVPSRLGTEPMTEEAVTGLQAKASSSAPALADDALSLRLRRPILVNEPGGVAAVWITVAMPSRALDPDRDDVPTVRDRIVPVLREAAAEGRLGEDALNAQLGAATSDLAYPPLAVTITQVARRR